MKFILLLISLEVTAFKLRLLQSCRKKFECVLVFQSGIIQYLSMFLF